MAFWLFAIMAALAFIGVFYHSQKGYATRMVYSLLLMLFWGALAYHFY